jgi:hypothetical protein
MQSPEPCYDPGAVTAEWLNAVLEAAGELDGARIVGFEREDIGTGQVGANVRFRLRYDADGDPTGPATLVGKFAAQDETSRATGVATRTYETEVAFYRDIAATVDISRPQCFYTAIEPGTADVVLVLEDLAPAVQGDQITGCGVAQAELAVDEAARLHGPRWGDDTLLDHGWLAEGVAARAGTGIADLFNFTWDGFVERYRDRLDPGALDVGVGLRKHITAWSTHEAAANTLTHGDYRLDNMLFGLPGSDRPLAVVDWQTVRLGCGTADVAYFLGAGLSVADRRTHERDLVARYHRGLLAYGIDDYPFDACWDDYRRYSYAGYVMAVIASILVGRTDRGDDMFMAMANRHAAQVSDLDARQLLL